MNDSKIGSVIKIKLLRIRLWEVLPQATVRMLSEVHHCKIAKDYNFPTPNPKQINMKL